MRLISLTARTAFNAQETDKVPVWLLTVTHELLAEPLRFSSDPTERLSTDPLAYGTTSRGEIFGFLPIGVVMPDDSADAPPAMRIVIDNVSRPMVQLLRSFSSPPADVLVEMVLSTTPDVVEVTWPAFQLVNQTSDGGQVTADLVVNAVATEPYPAGIFSPSAFPGLFA